MKRILIIDDDDKLIQPLLTYLERFDFETEFSLDPLHGLERLKSEDYDLLILDVMLPGIDGFETCRRLRQFSEIPVVMLTARGDVMDRVVGLEIGADDYLPKPFEPRELVARIQSILKRRVNPVQTSIFQFDDLLIDLDKKQVTNKTVSVDLTAQEFSLLEMLVKEPNRVFSRDEIMQQLRGIDADIYSRSIDVTVSRLRQKLQRSELIRTIRGMGYQFIDR